MFIICGAHLSLQWSNLAHSSFRYIHGKQVARYNIADLVLKGGICHFAKWQIPLFNTKVRAATGQSVAWHYLRSQIPSGVSLSVPAWRQTAVTTHWSWRHLLLVVFALLRGSLCRARSVVDKNPKTKCNYRPSPMRKVPVTDWCNHKSSRKSVIEY